MPDQRLENHIEMLLEEAYNLLTNYERRLLLSSEPKEQAKAGLEIEQIKKYIERLETQKNHLNSAQETNKTDLALIQNIETKLKEASLREFSKQEEFEVLTEEPSGSVGPEEGIKAFPSLLEKYDDFLKNFSKNLKLESHQNVSFEANILKSLKKAIGAQYVFLVGYANRREAIVSENEQVNNEIKGVLSKNPTLRELFRVAVDRKKAGTIKLPNSSLNCIFALHPAQEEEQLLVLYGVSADFEPDEVFEHILHTLLQIALSPPKQNIAEFVEIAVYNALKTRFGYVSLYVYNRHFQLFQERLKKMIVYFEPIIYIDPYNPEVWGWEALARDSATNEVPGDLIRTAELWGTRFQLELDMHFLKKAVELYVAPRKNRLDELRTPRKSELQPLSINLYPGSLLRTRYYETLLQIRREEKINLRIVHLEISEKEPIPTPATSEVQKEVMEAFKNLLKKFTDLGIHFTIDDFGVGYASSSRLSRLRPAVVKIDRDALLDVYGNLTISYVLNVAREIGGDLKVVVEGYDAKDSLFKLKNLYELGVRYIQGYEYGTAVPATEIGRLSEVVAEAIKKELKDFR